MRLDKQEKKAVFHAVRPRKIRGVGISVRSRELAVTVGKQKIKSIEAGNGKKQAADIEMVRQAVKESHAVKKGKNMSAPQREETWVSSPVILRSDVIERFAAEAVKPDAGRRAASVGKENGIKETPASVSAAVRSDAIQRFTAEAVRPDAGRRAVSVGKENGIKETPASASADVIRRFAAENVKQGIGQGKVSVEAPKPDMEHKTASVEAAKPDVEHKAALPEKETRIKVAPASASAETRSDVIERFAAENVKQGTGQGKVSVEAARPDVEHKAPLPEKGNSGKTVAVSAGKKADIHTGKAGNAGADENKEEPENGKRKDMLSSADRLYSEIRAYSMESRKSDRQTGKAAYDVKELERRCGVRRTAAGKKERSWEEKTINQERHEPEAGSVKERKSGKGERKREKEPGQTGKNRKDAIKKSLVREYMIKELTGENEPDAGKQLIKKMLQHDMRKLLVKMGRVFLMLAGKLFLFLLPVILITAVILTPVLLLYNFLMGPGAYFSSIYDYDDAVRDSPYYLKNVVQEMYTDFYGEITLFQDSNGYNQVEYAYGTYNNVEEIMAVYLTFVTTMDEYEDLRDTGIEAEYPPYLFIDTAKEVELLDTVFGEFNHTYMEEIQVTAKGEDGKEEKVRAYKMTVYFLTIDEWTAEYGSNLAGKEKKILEELLAKAEKGSRDNLAAFTGGAVPIEDLVVPAGVDEKVLYLAGFIRAEAGNQSDIGKTAVAYVILNRAGGSAGDIKGVLTAPYQFSCYIPYHTVEQYLTGYANMTEEERNSDSCWRIAVAAYTGTAENPIEDRKYYCNPKYCSGGESYQWSRIRAHNSASDITVIGDHVFCRYCW